MTDHEVYIFDADPDTVVSVTVRELRCLCTDEWEYCASDEDDSDIAIPERTCHFVDRDEDGNPAAYRDGFCDRCGEEMDDADRFCPNCGAEVVDE